MRAVEYALWQPDAAESVAGGPDEDEADIEDTADAVAEVVAEAHSTASRSATPAPSPPGSPPAPTPDGAEEVAPGPRTPQGGAISSALRPVFDPPPKVTPSSPLRDRLLGLLADGPGCTQGLATLLDAKELLISETLRVLQHEGRVVAGEVPPEGRRQQRWRLVEGGAAHEA
jgi:hypothetical protein